MKMSIFQDLHYSVFFFWPWAGELGIFTATNSNDKINKIIMSIMFGLLFDVIINNNDYINLLINIIIPSSLFD